MIGKLLPLLLILVGTGAGIGAGLALKPKPDKAAAAYAGDDAGYASEKDEEKHEDNHDDEHEAKGAKKSEKGHGKKGEGPADTHEYVKFNNQFLVPVVVDEQVNSLVVLTLSVEVTAGQSEIIYSREPKLRDAFLQVLFDHANVGGFQGEFTSAKNLGILRTALTEVAQSIAGDDVNGILITDIARQDV